MNTLSRHSSISAEHSRALQCAIVFSGFFRSSALSVSMLISDWDPFVGRLNGVYPVRIRPESIVGALLFSSSVPLKMGAFRERLSIRIAARNSAVLSTTELSRLGTLAELTQGGFPGVTDADGQSGVEGSI